MLYIALAAAAGLIGLDQLTKILVDKNMELHQSIPIISFGDTNVLNITYERNPGAAFSILEGKQMFLVIFTAIIIVAMLYLMISRRVKRPTYIWSTSLIVAGGLGNLIDRLLRGEVVDFIDVRIINFAVFNVADICSVLGAIGLLLFVVIDEIKEQKNKRSAKKNENADDNKEQDTAVTKAETVSEEK